MSFFQEDGLDGTFVIDLGSDLENSATVGSDEITNPKDLKRLENEISCDEDSDEDEVHSESSDDGEELLDYEAEDFWFFMKLFGFAVFVSIYVCNLNF